MTLSVTKGRQDNKEVGSIYHPEVAQNPDLIKDEEFRTFRMGLHDEHAYFTHRFSQHGSPLMRWVDRPEDKEALPVAKDMEKKYVADIGIIKRATRTMAIGSLAFGIASCSAYNLDVQGNFVQDVPEGYVELVEQEEKASRWVNSPNNIERSARDNKAELDGVVEKLTKTASERFDKINSDSWRNGVIGSDAANPSYNARQNSLRQELRAKIGEYDVVFRDIGEAIAENIQAQKDLIDENAVAKLEARTQELSRLHDERVNNPEFDAYESSRLKANHVMSSFGFAGWGLAFMSVLGGALGAAARGLKFKYDVARLNKKTGSKLEIDGDLF